jgi:predicted RNA-binding protein with PUA-like domain
MAKKYWLMKTEPDVFSIRDLQKEPKKTAHWDGVRNYQARNIMRDQMRVGDGVLFYHSGTNPSVVGTARVARAGYPDHTALDPKGKYYDPKSTRDKPVWYMVDIEFEKEFARPVPLSELRGVAALESMVLLKRGVRLSVQPVTPKEFRIVVRLGTKPASP